MTMLGAISESTPLIIKRAESPKTWKKGILVARLVTCATSIGEGYGLGIMAGAHALIQEDLGLTDNETALLVGTAYFAWAFGSPVGAVIADRIGRVPGMLISYLLMGCGSAMMAMSHHFRQILLGRVVEASGIGLGVTVITTYMVEISPTRLRGQLPSLEWTFMTMGVLLGWTSNRVLFGIPNDWRWMMGLGCVLPFICTVPILLGHVTESPRFLASTGRFEEAAASLKQLVHEEEFEAVVRSWREPTQLTVAKADAPSPLTMPCSTCATTSARLKGMALSLMLLCLPAFMGMHVILLFTTDVFAAQIGASSAMNLMLLLGITRVTVSAFTISIIDHVGRRQLMLPSLLGLSLSCFFVAFTYAADLPVFPWGFLAVVCFLCSMEMGYGPLSFVYSAEIFDSEIRSRGVAFCWFVGRLSTGCVITLFPRWSKTFGAASIFHVFGIVGICSMLVFWRFAPETNGVLLEDITSIMEGADGADEVSADPENCKK